MRLLLLKSIIKIFVYLYHLWHKHRGVYKSIY